MSFVSRAGEKLNSVVSAFDISFENKTVLDVGSSTGGFTDLVLQQGAKRVVAVDIGTNQLHPKLRTDQRVELHEKTNILNFPIPNDIDYVVMDISFASARDILLYIKEHISQATEVLVMVKPQFEAKAAQKNRGVVKNERVRRQILQAFETWVKTHYYIANKKDSAVLGSKGNIERFYHLKKLSTDR